MMKCDICTWHSLIVFCGVSGLGWLFCLTLLSQFAGKTHEIADLVRQDDKTADKISKSICKWSVIGAVSLGLLSLICDALVH